MLVCVLVRHNVEYYIFIYFVGNRFGLMQAKLTLLKILSKYEVTPCKETLIPVEIDPRGAMTVPLNGVIHLNFRKISTAI